MIKAKTKQFLCGLLAVCMTICLLPAFATTVQAAEESFFEMEDFGAWGATWPNAVNVGWKLNANVNINSIEAIEVGILNSEDEVIVVYSANKNTIGPDESTNPYAMDQITWQKVNSYITTGGQSSAPFYQEYNGKFYYQDFVDSDWTVNYGPAYVEWEPATAYVTMTVDGVSQTKTNTTFTGTVESSFTPVEEDWFEMQDFGAWGETWPNAVNVGWKYEDAFNTNEIIAIEVGIKDAAGKSIVTYSADRDTIGVDEQYNPNNLDQISWQLENGYVSGTKQSSAPYYQTYGETFYRPENSIGADWTITYGEAYADWAPATAYVTVETPAGTQTLYNNTFSGTVESAYAKTSDEWFHMEDFGAWGDTWPNAVNVGWKYEDSFYTEQIDAIEVGIKDAAGNLIVKYTADRDTIGVDEEYNPDNLDQISWQLENGYVSGTKQSSAPFYQEYDGTYVTEGSVGADWTVVLGDEYAEWEPASAYVIVTNVNGQQTKTNTTFTGTVETSFPKVVAAKAAIRAIGTVELTDACKEKIDAATEALGKVPDSELSLVPEKDTDTLADAIEEYNKLKACKEAEEKFTDISREDWYFESVAYVNAKGYMGRVETGKFMPMDKLTREQFATIIYRMADEPEVTFEKKFPDVEAVKWYSNPICWANKNGIITGYEDGMFGLGDNITREQLAVMLYRYAKYMQYDVSARADLSTFTDAESVSSWAKEAMQWAVAEGIIKGKYNGTKLDPTGYAARCECAAIIERFEN